MIPLINRQNAARLIHYRARKGARVKKFIRKINDVRYVPRLIVDDLIEAIRRQIKYIGKRRKYTVYSVTEGKTIEEKSVFSYETVTGEPFEAV